MSYESGIDADVDPNPTRLAAGEERLPIEVRRSLFCPVYRRCLNQAVMKDWRDFSCRRCGLYGRTNADADAYANDRGKGPTIH